jgi:hypothetical protein
MLWSAQELYILQITKLNTKQYIYGGGYFLLTEAVTKNRLAKSIYGDGYKITTS